MFRLIFMLLAIIFITGCVQVLSVGCDFIGGKPDVNFGGFQKCGKIYSDGGMTCTSSSECEGDCFLDLSWNPKSEKPPHGWCAKSSSANGVWCTIIEDHGNQRAFCIEE